MRPILIFAFALTVFACKPFAPSSTVQDTGPPSQSVMIMVDQATVELRSQPGSDQLILKVNDQQIGVTRMHYWQEYVKQITDLGQLESLRSRYQYLPQHLREVVHTLRDRVEPTYAQMRGILLSDGVSTNTEFSFDRGNLDPVLVATLEFVYSFLDGRQAPAMNDPTMNDVFTSIDGINDNIASLEFELIRHVVAALADPSISAQMQLSLAVVKGVVYDGAGGDLAMLKSTATFCTTECGRLVLSSNLLGVMLLKQMGVDTTQEKLEKGMVLAVEKLNELALAYGPKIVEHMLFIQNEASKDPLFFTRYIDKVNRLTAVAYAMAMQELAGQPPEAIRKAIGQAMGMISYEVLLSVGLTAVTAGAGGAAGIAKATHTIAKLGRLVSKLQSGTKAARAQAQVLASIVKGIEKLIDLIKRISFSRKIKQTIGQTDVVKEIAGRAKRVDDVVDSVPGSIDGLLRRGRTPASLAKGKLGAQGKALITKLRGVNANDIELPRIKAAGYDSWDDFVSHWDTTIRELDGTGLVDGLEPWLQQRASAGGFKTLDMVNGLNELLETRRWVASGKKVGFAGDVDWNFARRQILEEFDFDGTDLPMSAKDFDLLVSGRGGDGRSIHTFVEIMRRNEAVTTGDNLRSAAYDAISHALEKQPGIDSSSFTKLRAKGHLKVEASLQVGFDNAVGAAQQKSMLQTLASQLDDITRSAHSTRGLPEQYAVDGVNIINGNGALIARYIKNGTTWSIENVRP